MHGASVDLGRMQGPPASRPAGRPARCGGAFVDAACNTLQMQRETGPGRVRSGRDPVAPMPVCETPIRPPDGHLLSNERPRGGHQFTFPSLSWTTFVHGKAGACPSGGQRLSMEARADPIRHRVRAIRGQTLPARGPRMARLWAKSVHARLKSETEALACPRQPYAAHRRQNISSARAAPGGERASAHRASGGLTGVVGRYLRMPASGSRLCPGHHASAL
jgi:hypothetical protein